MVSTMPKVFYDSLKFNMNKLSSYHEHANGDISEIQGRIKDVPVKFLKGIAMVYFFVVKPNQGNIVLGRDFLRAVKGFIDIGKGQIRLRGKSKGVSPFPRNNKSELVEEPFEAIYNSDYYDGY